jgi:hypothetical protein
MIGGFSNFEVLELKDSVKGQMNSVLGHENADFRDAFRTKPIIKTPITLYKTCRGIHGLQLCYLHLGALSSRFLKKILVKTTLTRAQHPSVL